jgi:hypothetical protein
MRVLAATLVIAAGALAVVLASGGGDDEEPARPPAARSPDSPSPEPAGGERLEWPARGDGYTVVVAISEDGRGPALARARRARRLGLDAGVLNSSDYSSLEPGKTVAFVGIFLNRSAARKEADRVERLGLTQAPYVVFVNGAG